MARTGTGPGSLRRTIPLLVVLAVAVAGCSSSRSSKPTAEIDPSPASQANIASLTAVVNQDPSDASGYNVRGTAYGKAGKYREAIADFDRAIEIDPRFARAYANRALVHRRNGDIRADACFTGGRDCFRMATDSEQFVRRGDPVGAA